MQIIPHNRFFIALTGAGNLCYNILIDGDTITGGTVCIFDRNMYVLPVAAYDKNWFVLRSEDGLEI